MSFSLRFIHASEHIHVSVHIRSGNFPSAEALLRARHLNNNLDRGQEPRRRQEAPPVTPMAALVLTTAARMLPAREQTRYTEEFLSELWEIAHAGGTRRSQLAYAARQVTAAGWLHAALWVPQRHSTSRQAR
jgi:hypothetical protein